MKKILVIMLALVLCISCVFAVGCNDNKPTLQIYTNAGFAPYEYVNTNGEVVGVDMDIVKQIGEILGYKVVINDIEFDLILDEVQKNELAIGAAGMTKTEGRDAIALASISYATSVQYVIVAKNTFSASDLVEGKLPLAKLADLTNKVIGVQEGTTGNFLVDDAINVETDVLYGKGNSLITYTNAIVASGDIGTTLGAVVIDKLPAESIVASNSNLECFELDAEPESYVLYLNKNATSLKTKIDAILEAMIEGGVIDFFTLKHSGGIID